MKALPRIGTWPWVFGLYAREIREHLSTLKASDYASVFIARTPIAVGSDVDRWPTWCVTDNPTCCYAIMLEHADDTDATWVAYAPTSSIAEACKHLVCDWLNGTPVMVEDNGPVLTKTDLASRFKVVPGKITDWVNSQVLPAPSGPGGLHTWFAGDIIRHIASMLHVPGYGGFYIPHYTSEKDNEH